MKTIHEQLDEQINLSRMNDGERIYHYLVPTAKYVGGNSSFNFRTKLRTTIAVKYSHSPHCNGSFQWTKISTQQYRKVKRLILIGRNWDGKYMIWDLPMKEVYRQIGARKSLTKAPETSHNATVWMSKYQLDDPIELRLTYN